MCMCFGLIVDIIKHKHTNLHEGISLCCSEKYTNYVQQKKTLAPLIALSGKLILQINKQQVHRGNGGVANRDRSDALNVNNV